MSGVPVVVVPKGGLPVRSVDGGAPVMTIADNGMGIPITYSNNGAPFVVRGGGPAWTPEQLFDGGQPGFWAGGFAPTSLRLFQDDAGTTPANQAGQPVGKVARAAGTVDASQATALSRPTLARWPKGGRRNLLTWTEDFGNAVWVKLGSITENAATAPNGSLTALALGVGARVHQMAGKTEPLVTYSLFVSNGIARVGVLNSAARGATFDTTTKMFSSIGSNVINYGYEQSSEGYCRVWVATDAGPTYQWGVASEKLLVWGAQLELGSTATPYQRVTTAIDVSEAGVPDVWHLWNDGGDSLPAILPAGAYEIAWATPLGAVSYASVTSDGTAGTNLLRAERMADVLVREGALTPAEKTALEAYWSQRYAA